MSPPAGAQPKTATAAAAVRSLRAARSAAVMKIRVCSILPGILNQANPRTEPSLKGVYEKKLRWFRPRSGKNEKNECWLHLLCKYPLLK